MVRPLDDVLSDVRPPPWRRAAALTAAAVLLLSAGAAAAPEDPDIGRLPAAPTCAEPGAVSRLGSWAAVRTPEFEQRPLGQGQDVTSYVVSPHDQRRVFVTNGTSVLRSLDAGCTWTEVYVLPAVATDEEPLSVAGSRLRDLRVPEDPRAASRVLAVAQEVAGDEGTRPHLLVSEDGTEDSFERRDTGLPDSGDVTDLEVSPTNPDFVFVSLSLTPPPPGPEDGAPDLPPLPPLPGIPGVGSPTAPDVRSAPRGALYLSRDGGASFAAQLDPTDLAVATSALEELVTDPLAANQLWAVSGGVLRHSDDAGATFRAAVPTPEEQAARGWDVTTLVVDAGPDRSRRVLAFTRTSAQKGGPRLLTSTDSGVTFDEISAPGPVDSAVLVGADRRTLAVSTTGRRAGVHVLPTDRPAVDVTPLDSDRPFALSTDRTPRATLHASAPGVLLRYVGPLVTPPAVDPPPVGAVVDDVDLPPLGVGRFTPAADDVKLQAGRSTTVPHRLELPRRTTPLDLYVLVDTTISMKDDLPAVTRDLLALVDRLVAQGVDLRVGLGEFKGQESTIAYRRVQGVGPQVDDFRSALTGLKADGFGLEMQLIALEQALLGAGEGPDALVPASCKAPERSPDRFVLDEKRTAPPTSPGQAADFSPSHVKVVLTVTDTVFLRPAGTRLTPDCRVDTLGVARQYAAAGVHQVGVGIDDVDNPATAEDLVVGARETRTLQPGSACAPELQPAGPGPHPAVCRTASDLEASLLSLVEQQSEPTDVRMTRTGATDVLAVAALPRVDLRRPRPLDVPVTYTCPDEPGTFTGSLRVSVPEREVAVLPYRLVCTPPPPQIAPLLLLQQPAVAAAVPLVGLLPPPVPVPPPAPPAQAAQAQAQTQPQSQTQAQAQSGTQEQQESAAQLAFALQGLAQDEGTTVQAMSAREVPDVVRISVLAMMTAAAGGVAVRRRTALRPVPVRLPGTRR